MEPSPRGAWLANRLCVQSRISHYQREILGPLLGWTSSSSLLSIVETGRCPGEQQASRPAGSCRSDEDSQPGIEASLFRDADHDEGGPVMPSIINWQFAGGSGMDHVLDSCRTAGFLFEELVREMTAGASVAAGPLASWWWLCRSGFSSVVWVDLAVGGVDSCSKW